MRGSFPGIRGYNAGPVGLFRRLPTFSARGPQAALVYSAAVQLLPRGATFATSFVVDETLGLGSTGAVLAARDTARGGAQVALKVLRPELAADDDLRARFRREAMILQQLDDPAIVAVHTHGEAPLTSGGLPLPYLVMERLHGRTLRGVLGDGPQSLDDVLAWLVPVARALERTHAAGVLHGDLKPDNLFLTASGPRLVDFGSAKVHGFPRLTATGELAGTPRYMAPEVIAGARELDARADVYALGVTVFECVSGRAPFTARHPGRLLTEIMSGDAPSLAQLDPALTSIAAVVARAMARDPRARFESTETFARALARSLTGTTSPAPDRGDQGP